MNQFERQVKEIADFEIGGFENELMDGNECDFFEQSIVEQVEDIYNIIINQVQKEVRFLGTARVKEIIEKCLKESEYNG